MLKDRFYSVLSSSQDTFRVRLNPEHPIFSGHFPSYPIVPGVCLMQMASELYGRDLAGARDVKFLVPVLPSETKDLDFSFNGQVVTVSDGDTVFARMKLEFV